MNNTQKKAIKLRYKGKSYSDIGHILGVSKSTLSYWLGNLELTNNQKRKIEQNVIKKLIVAREKSIISYQKRKIDYFTKIENRNKYLINILNNNKDAAKLVLSVLHLGEGSKNRRGSMQMGNSDPGIIKLFLRLMKTCYDIDKFKFRCTILCRADQDIKKLENFWIHTTGINKKQFYKTRIDPRTIGKPSRKLDYKGVCVINYFSADVYYDLLTLGKMMSA